ncbi:hypothetical protein MMC13_007683 [Lambiella insularis]|nr:hypothetical protein [Lambiella insularis]
MKVTPSGDTETKDRLDQALREGRESYMQLMDSMFGSAGWLAIEVLRGMRDSDDFYVSQVGQIRAPRIHDGRVVLLGDAAYATPGFGTSLAIIGGYVLAGELLSHPGDVKAAVRRYEEILLPFAKSSQGFSGVMQVFNPQTAWGIGVRNAIFGFVTWTRLDRLAVAGAAALGFTEKKAPILSTNGRVCEE